MENAAGVAWQETKNAAGVACQELRARPEECAAQFREQGLLRVNGVVGRATCERLREEGYLRSCEGVWQDSVCSSTTQSH